MKYYLIVYLVFDSFVHMFLCDIVLPIISTTYKTAQNSNIDTKEFCAVLFLLFEINNL